MEEERVQEEKIATTVARRDISHVNVPATRRVKVKAISSSRERHRISSNLLTRATTVRDTIMAASRSTRAERRRASGAPKASKARVGDTVERSSLEDIGAKVEALMRLRMTMRRLTWKHMKNLE